MTISKILLPAGIFFAPLVAASLSRLATAGPPLVTDDPETPGRSGWEINISHNIEMTQGEFLMETPLIDINYGLLENDQWKIEFPVLLVDPDDGDERWGVGDLLIGWKYRFLEEDEHGLMASIYPQPLIPTSHPRLGLSEGHVELLLPIEVGKHFCDDKLLVYAEVGYNVVLHSSGTNEWIYGVAAEWEHSEKLELLFEAGGVAPEGSSEPDFAFFNGGLKYKLSDHWTLIASAGRSFRERNSGTPVLLTFLGIQITTGGQPDRK